MNAPVIAAQLQRLACFVPDLGIYSCASPSLVMARPVSVTRNGLTLTVHQLLSAGGVTILQIQVQGLPPEAAQPHVATSGADRVELHDDRGNLYPPLAIPGADWLGVHPDPTRPQTEVFYLESTFAPLDAQAHVVDVRVDWAPPIGTWDVQVPVALAQAASYVATQPLTASETHQGVTLQVVSAEIDPTRTALDITASGTPPIHAIRSLGSLRYLRAIPGNSELAHPTLRDDHGNAYPEQFTIWTRFNTPALPYQETLTFPPLVRDAKQAELTIPFVTVKEETGDATLSVPIPTNPTFRHGWPPSRQISDPLVNNAAVQLGPGCDWY